MWYLYLLVTCPLFSEQYGAYLHVGIFCQPLIFFEWYETTKWRPILRYLEWHGGAGPDNFGCVGNFCGLKTYILLILLKRCIKWDRELVLKGHFQNSLACIHTLPQSCDPKCWHIVLNEFTVVVPWNIPKISKDFMLDHCILWLSLSHLNTFSIVLSNLICQIQKKTSKGLQNTCESDESAKWVGFLVHLQRENRETLESHLKLFTQPLTRAFTEKAVLVLTIEMNLSIWTRVAAIFRHSSRVFA